MKQLEAGRFVAYVIHGVSRRPSGADSSPDSDQRPVVVQVGSG